MSTKKAYLGDGVYAEFDGWQIWLRAKHAKGWHEIALEPEVFDALVAYSERVWKERECQHTIPT